MKARKDWDKPDTWPGASDDAAYLGTVKADENDQPESKSEKRRAETPAVDVIDTFARPV